MELDEAVGSSSAQATRELGLGEVVTGLSVDLPSRCAALLSNLGIDPVNPATKSPIIVPSVVIDYALYRATQSPSDLLDALSLLVAIDGISDQVIQVFEPILLDLCARWLGLGTVMDEEWEQRLILMASLASLRPDLWE